MPLPLAVPAALSEAKKLPVIGGVVSGITSTFQASDPQKDADRDRNTDAAFNKALSGDVNAIAYLHARGGKMDILKPNIPGYGMTLGWGSKHSKDYAEAKYDQIAAMPSLAAAVAQADALLRHNATPSAGVTDTLTRTVGAVGMPVWAVLVLLAGAALLTWYLLRRR